MNPDDDLRQFGNIMRAWVDSRRGEFRAATLSSPFDAPGMDPTWVLDFETEDGSASACLFRGPYLDLSWARWDDAQAQVAGHEAFEPADVKSILDRLAVSIGSKPSE